MRLIRIMVSAGVLMTALAFASLGGCHASVGVDGHHHEHVHGEGCGHHWDGHDWR